MRTRSLKQARGALAKETPCSQLGAAALSPVENAEPEAGEGPLTEKISPRPSRPPSLTRGAGQRRGAGAGLDPSPRRALTYCRTSRSSRAREAGSLSEKARAVPAGCLTPSILFSLRPVSFACTRTLACAGLRLNPLCLREPVAACNRASLCVPLSHLLAHPLFRKYQHVDF